MPKEGKLFQMVNSFKLKVLLPIFCLSLLPSCYTHIETSSRVPPSMKEKIPAYGDLDRDGIPNIYDPNPYIYNYHPKSNGIWFNFYYFPLRPYHRFSPPWENFHHPKPHFNTMPIVPKEKMNNERTRIRNDDGNRNNKNRGVQKGNSNQHQGKIKTR